MSLLVPAHMNAGDVWRSSIVNAILDALSGGAHQFTKQTADYTALLTDMLILIDATAGNVIVTLPKASTCGGKPFLVVKVDSSGNTVTVTSYAGDTIEGNATVVLSTQYHKAFIDSDGVSLWESLFAELTAGGSFAPDTAHYLLGMADGSLPNGIVISAYPFVDNDIDAAAAIAVTKLAAGSNGQVLTNVGGTNQWGSAPPTPAAYGAFSDVTGSRAINAYYTNSTGHEILVEISVDMVISTLGDTSTFKIIGTVATELANFCGHALPSTTPAGTYTVSIIFPVPNGATYYLDDLSSASPVAVNNWCETS